MKERLVPMDGAGRIVLPKQVRQELALKAGDHLKIALQGAGVILMPARETSGFVRKGKALVFSTAGNQTMAAETVNDLLEKCRNEQTARLYAAGAEHKRGR